MNTLLSPLIRAVRPEGDPALLTLPGVFAALMADQIAAFPALRAHQRHAWHAFLVQLGAMALHAAGLTEPPDTEAAWRELLRALTPDDPDDHAWSLVAPPDRPALLQPPIPDGLAALKTTIATPDGLDMLETSKNHDFKQAVMVSAQPDDWLFALLTLQTMAPWGGRDHYAISRMNGNQGTRAAIGVIPSGGVGQHVRRDITRLLSLRHGILQRSAYAETGGTALLWLVPWDGSTSLLIESLDPLYIEICRRVRLVAQEGALVARSGTSKTERIVRHKDGGGVTGDPWAPVQKDQDGSIKVPTIQSHGLDYRSVVRLMFEKGGGWQAPLQEIADTDADKDLLLLARVLAREDQKSAGYHERRVPLSRKVRFRGPTDPAADAARARVELAAEVKGRVLEAALTVLLDNGNDDLHKAKKGAKEKAKRFSTAFDGFVDRSFFEDLWAELEHDEPVARDAARTAWVRGLLGEARAILNRADEAAPKASHRRWRARVRAQATLHSAAWRSDKLRPHLEQEKAHDDAA